MLHIFSVMMPLWIYTLGKTYLSDDFEIVIPYLSLLQAMATMIIPLLVGIAIKWKSPKATVVILTILKPSSALIVVFVISMSLYSHWYSFKMITGVYVLAACMLPYFGYIFGGLIAWALRQPRERIIAISLETGMQHIGIAFLLLLLSFPPPIGDIAALAPMTSLILTPIVPLLFLIALAIYRKFCGNYKQVNIDEQETKVAKDEL